MKRKIMRIQAVSGSLAIVVALAGSARADLATSSMGADATPFQKGMSFQIQKGAAKAPPVLIPKGRFLEIQFASALCRGPSVDAVLEITTVIGKAEQHFVPLGPISGVGFAGATPLAAYAEPGSQVVVQVHPNNVETKRLGIPVSPPTCQVTLSGVMRSADKPALATLPDKLGLLGPRGGLLDISGSGPGGTIRRTFQCTQGSYETGCKANKCSRAQGVGQFDGCSEFAKDCKNAGLTWTPHSEGDDAGGTCSVKQ